MWNAGLDEAQTGIKIARRNINNLRYEQLNWTELNVPLGFPGGSDGKVSAYNAGNPGSIPGLGGSPGEGNGNPFQYSCLENPMDRGAW